MAVALGPVAGGFLLEHFWWGAVFLVNIPIVAIALVAGHFLIPESREPHQGRFDLVGLTLAVFARYEARREHPLLYVTFFRNARFSADTAYWGPIIISMLFIANGLSLVTSPSTEAVMGSVPRERAGVAVTGSIFISLHTPQLTDRFTRIPGLVDALPSEVFGQAQDSVGAAYAVAQNGPAIVQPQVLQAVSDSFMRGFGTACLVVSAVAFVGSLFALRFLPARAQRPSSQELT